MRGTGVWVAGRPELSIAPLELLEGLPDTVVVADNSGRIVYINAAVRTLLGHDPARLLGQPVTVLMPERYRRLHNAGFTRFLTTGQGELLGTTTQVTALHADGGEVPIDLTLSHLGAAAAVPGGVVVAVLRDASTKVLLERQLEVSRYLTATLRVTAALAQAPDAGTAFEVLLPALCEQLDWDAAYLWQPDDRTGRLACTAMWHASPQHGHALPGMSGTRTFGAGEGLPGLTWRSRTPVVVEDLRGDRRFLRAAAAAVDGMETGVAFPVLHGKTMLAVCELFARDTRRVAPELLQVLSGTGHQIDQFLAGVRVRSQVRELADTLQRSLLPATLPAIPGVQLAACYQAGGEGVLVGGDTYDVIEVPGGQWMVLIADVCGMGPEAASISALTRHTARAAAITNPDPGHVLSTVNAALLQQATAGRLKFVTACCALLTPHRRGATVRIAVAGHPPPLLRSPDGTVTQVGSTGRLLGVFPDVDHGQASVDLEAGSILLLYTDGVTEARDHTGTQFGEDRLAQLLHDTPATSPGATLDAIEHAVEEHLSTWRGKGDDLALLALGC